MQKRKLRQFKVLLAEIPYSLPYLFPLFIGHNAGLVATLKFHFVAPAEIFERENSPDNRASVLVVQSFLGIVLGVQFKPFYRVSKLVLSFIIEQSLAGCVETNANTRKGDGLIILLALLDICHSYLLHLFGRVELRRSPRRILAVLFFLVIVCHFSSLFPKD